MADDDQSPERTRRDDVANWTDTAQRIGATPRETETVRGAVIRGDVSDSNDATNNNPGNHSPQDMAWRQAGDEMFDALEEEQTARADRNDVEDNTTDVTPWEGEQTSPTPSDQADANPTGIPVPANPSEDDGGSWWGGDESTDSGVWSDAEQAMQQASDPIGAGIDAIGEATQNIYDGVSEAVQNAYDSFGDGGGGDFSDGGGESFSDDGGGWE